MNRVVSCSMAAFPRRGWAVLALLGLAGCGLFPKVPEEFKGDTNLWVDNGLNAKICFFSMTPRGAPRPSEKNWLGSLGLDGNNVMQLAIKPGEYTMRLTGCNKQFDAEHQVRIAQPTVLSIGQATVGCPTCSIGVDRSWAKQVVQVHGNVGLGTVSVKCFEDGSTTDGPDACCNGSRPIGGHQYRCGR